eukprot:jgi/Ulvmu1/1785/UM119_0003.1
MYSLCKLLTCPETPSAKFGSRRAPSQPATERRKIQVKCHALVADVDKTDLKSQTPNDMSSTGPIDVILQMSTQHRVYRATLLMCKPSGLVPSKMQPEEAVEVGPVDGRVGPCLLLLKGIPSPAAEFLAWFDEAQWLRRCVTRVYLFPPEQPSHCAPNLEDLLRKVVASTDPQQRMQPLRLQCSPRTSEMAIILELDTHGFTFDPRQFQAVLSCVHLDTYWRYAFSPAGTYWRLSHVQQQFHGDASSSASNKLAEALQLLSLDQAGFKVAVDLGAAPGAWTELLASKGADTVFAVDPAELSEQCRSLPNVVHVQKRSEDAVPEIAAALRGRQVDIIVCDMNQLPQQCAPCIEPLLPLLAPGGYAILTCKFAGNGRYRTDSIAKVRALPAFEGLVEGQFVMLLANTLKEGTWIARKPPASQQGA